MFYQQEANVNVKSSKLQGRLRTGKVDFERMGGERAGRSDHKDRLSAVREREAGGRRQRGCFVNTVYGYDD